MRVSLVNFYIFRLSANLTSSYSLAVPGSTGSFETPVLPGEAIPEKKTPPKKKATTPKKSSAAKLKNAAKKVKAVNAITRKSPSKRVAKKSTPVRKAVPKKSPSKNWAKVKKEVLKSTPRRSARSGIKKGFYNEVRLASVVWKGEGTFRDPIQFK